MLKSLTIGRLALAFYLCLPLEGILRKWVFVDAEQAFGFIRDPILIAIYFVYVFRWRRALPMWAAMYFLFAGLFVAYVLIFAIFNATPPIVVALGIRSYVLYIPLAFILGQETQQRRRQKNNRYLALYSRPHRPPCVFAIYVCG